MTEATKTVVFWLGDQQLGADIAHVKETIVVKPITRVFLTPDWVAGIMNLRGDIVCVLDLGALLGLPRGDTAAPTRIVLCRWEGRTAGLLVDRVGEARTLDFARLAPPPATLPGETASLLAGVATLEGGAPLMVLDLPKLFESPRLRQFSRRAEA